MELEQKLDQIQGELKIFVEKAQAEQKTNGSVLAETKTAFDALQKQVDAMDATMQKTRTGTAPKSFAAELAENESMQRLVRDGSGTAILRFKSLADLERKTTITSAVVGSATSGVLNPERLPGIVKLPEQRLFIRDVLPAAGTTANAIDYVKELAFSNAASPQVEALAKAESALTFVTGTAPVRTIAHWIPATKQILDDFPGLQQLIASKLLYGYKIKEEREILSGDNTGEHLNGLITQATSFVTGLLSATNGWEKADILARSIQQLQVANQPEPDWFALNPADWWDIQLNKDSAYQYIAANAYSVLPSSLWGKRVIASNSIDAGTFLAGNSMNAMVRDREGVNVSVSTEHADFFIKNLVAIRVEGRLALVVTVPASFIVGSLTTSPA